MTDYHMFLLAFQFFVHAVSSDYKRVFVARANTPWETFREEAHKALEGTPTPTPPIHLTIQNMTTPAPRSLSETTIPIIAATSHSTSSQPTSSQPVFSQSALFESPFPSTQVPTSTSTVIDDHHDLPYSPELLSDASSDCSCACESDSE